MIRYKWRNVLGKYIPGRKKPKLSIILAVWYHQNVVVEKKSRFIRFGPDSRAMGSRGLTVYNIIGAKRIRVTAQALRTMRKPHFSRPTSMMNGKTTPATPLPALYIYNFSLIAFSEPFMDY